MSSHLPTSSSGGSPSGRKASDDAAAARATGFGFAGFAAFVLLVALGVAGRLLPHPPHFTPVAAAALFAGFFFPLRTLAVLVPLGTMAISDGIIGVYDYRITIAVYAGLAFPVLFGPLLARKPGVLRVGLCAASSSLAFFVVSNFSVWLHSGMYEHTAAGLVRCYVMALPFLRFTLSGDLVWSAALFGGYALLARGLGLVRKRAEVEDGAARALGLLRVAAAPPVKD